MELCPHRLTAALLALSIRSLIGPVIRRPFRTFQCSTPQRNMRRQPKSCFGENQLLHDSVSFSLLTSSHPTVLHYRPVRASPHISMGFTLLKASSSCFGSIVFHLNFALFKLAFAVASRLSLLAERNTITRWLILQ
jgi:hypothetical protein